MSDGLNSLSHVLFGGMAYFKPIITPIFLVYQFATMDKNVFVDVAEFVVGLTLVTCLNK